MHSLTTHFYALCMACMAAAPPVLSAPAMLDAAAGGDANGLSNAPVSREDAGLLDWINTEIQEMENQASAQSSSSSSSWNENTQQPPEYHETTHPPIGNPNQANPGSRTPPSSSSHPGSAPNAGGKGASPDDYFGPSATHKSFSANEYKAIVLEQHTLHRRNHSAQDMQWGPRMAAAAKEWALQCTFSHNTQVGGGDYGQNLMAGNKPPDVAEAITEYWYNAEMPLYNAYGRQPDMSSFEGWGHFTQVVWKGSTHVGCYTADCSAHGLANVPGNVPPYLTVCNYHPAGNVMGSTWAENVGQPLGHQTVHVHLQLTVGVGVGVGE